jgi:hypothetical protein
MDRATQIGVGCKPALGVAERQFLLVFSRLAEFASIERTIAQVGFVMDRNLNRRSRIDGGG